MGFLGWCILIARFVCFVGGCSNQNELYYCQLQRQMLLIESNADLSEAALAVGLAERSSIEPL